MERASSYETLYFPRIFRRKITRKKVTKRELIRGLFATSTLLNKKKESVNDDTAGVG